MGAWEPEIEAKGRSWNALIEQELDRSMALYERPAAPPRESDYLQGGEEL